jgi:flagellar basal body-associated protein FliL
MGKIGLIIGLLNTVAIAGVLGLFAYTKLVYKHPPLTEEQERAKLEQKVAAPVKSNEKSAMFPLDPVTVNLDPFTDSEGKQKIHYVSMTLVLEIRSEKDKAKVNKAKPVVMDKIIQGLSKKKFEDLNQVQGRYVFRSQIIDAANEFLGSPVVTEIYFNDFLLQ